MRLFAGTLADPRPACAVGGARGEGHRRSASSTSGGVDRPRPVAGRPDRQGLGPRRRPDRRRGRRGRDRGRRTTSRRRRWRRSSCRVRRRRARRAARRARPARRAGPADRPAPGRRAPGDLACRSTARCRRRSSQATLADDYGARRSTFRETTTICVERPVGTGAAFELIGTDGNPFLATVGLRVEPAPVGAGVAFRLEVELGLDAGRVLHARWRRPCTRRLRPGPARLAGHGLRR